MGSLDSVESSDLVGLFILYNLIAYEDVNVDSIALYTRDGLMLVKNSTKIKNDS